MYFNVRIGRRGSVGGGCLFWLLAVLVSVELWVLVLLCRGVAQVCLRAIRWTLAYRRRCLTTRQVP